MSLRLSIELATEATGPRSSSWRRRKDHDGVRGLLHGDEGPVHVSARIDGRWEVLTPGPAGSTWRFAGELGQDGFEWSEVTHRVFDREMPLGVRISADRLREGVRCEARDWAEVRIQVDGHTLVVHREWDGTAWLEARGAVLHQRLDWRVGELGHRAREAVA